MAISTSQQSGIINLVVGMFNAAPGADILSALEDIYEAYGYNLEALADALAQHQLFQQQFSYSHDNSYIANSLLANFDLSQGTQAGDVAYNFFHVNLNNGVSVGNLMKMASEYLLSDDCDPMFSSYAAKYANKCEVASYFSVTKGLSGSMDELESVLASVTENSSLSSLFQAIDDLYDSIDNGSGDYYLEFISGMITQYTALLSQYAGEYGIDFDYYNNVFESFQTYDEMISYLSNSNEIETLYNTYLDPYIEAYGIANYDQFIGLISNPENLDSFIDLLA